MTITSILEHVEGLDPDRISSLEELGKTVGRDVVAEVAEVILSDIQPSLDALDTWEPGDEGVDEIAHRLKGSLINFGATRLGKRCGDLEIAAREGDDAKAELELKSIQPALNRFVAELSKYLERRK